jgi:hypothetical protein
MNAQDRVDRLALLDTVFGRNGIGRAADPPRDAG